MRWFMSSTIGRRIITWGHAFGMFRCKRQIIHASPNMPKACPYAMALSFWEIDSKPKGRFFWFVYAKGIPKVTMFAVEMWFGVGDGVECGRSTGLCPLPLGVPRCVIHNKKMLERNFW